MIARLANRRAGHIDWRGLVGALALVVFAAQSFITATHIHPGHFRAGTPVQFSSSQHGPADDPANCPICLDLALSGHYLTPAAVILVAPVSFAILTALAASLPSAVLARSHGWHGRAPPQA